MQKVTSPPNARSRLVVRDERWTLIGANRYDDTSLLRVRGADRDNRDELLTFITPADRVQPAPHSTALRRMRRGRVIAHVARAVADTGCWTHCWTASSARIDVRAWQLEPAAAAVSGTMRILLADEVGMGKTIQAGLIIAELRSRGLADRTLVLTPASLRAQWAAELSDRFRLDPSIFDQSSLALATASLPPDVNPWRTTSLAIASIDLVKRPEVRAALEAVPIDVLVVDEAHHLTPGTDRAAVVAELAARSLWLVLATATPHRGDDAAYAFLQQLGEGGPQQLQVFRRSQSAEAGRAERRSRTLFVQPTPAERALLDATSAYAQALARANAPAGRLLGSVIGRRAASSATAVHHTLLRRIALLAQTDHPRRQPLLPWEEPQEDEVDERVLASQGLADVHDEVRQLQRLADLASIARARSSKVNAVRRLLRRTAEPLLVFSEYRDVVLILASAVADLSSVVTLHGGLTPAERRRAIDAFTSGRVRTMVATDAAGEGLNLQHRCRTVVNIELPWTPLCLEQRIGRVDRLGQSRRVHAIHLAHRGSFEGTVMARLERRRTAALTALTGGAVSSSESAAAVARRLRQLAGPDRNTGERFAAVYTPSGRRGTRVLLAFACEIVDACDRVVERHCLPLAIDGVRLPGRRLTRRAVRQLVAAPAIRDALARLTARHLASACDRVATSANAIVDRADHLLERLERRGRGDVWQDSLFDRRAEQQRRVRDVGLTIVREHLHRQRGLAVALRQLQGTTPRLIAAWME